MTELVRVFLKLGFTAFGGPAAHIAMLEEEVVERRGWMSRAHFLDLVGATNLIPGPNSTEMCLHVGYERGGWRGLIVAGVFFIGPAVLLTSVLAWSYVRFGALPTVEPWLFGIKPAVIAIILTAVWRLGRKAARGWRLATVGGVVTCAVLFGLNPVLALAAGGLVGMAWLRGADRTDGSPPPVNGAALVIPGFGGALGQTVGLTVAAATGLSLWKLGLVFLKVGAILYGSGYVLVAFLRGDLVERYGWLTEGQLLDAIAIGQFTPGPILSTATFIGYVVLGVPGAVVATVGIFLPSFLFVLALNPLIPRLRERAWTAAFLDAVNVAAVGLMLAVTIQLAYSTLTSWPAVTIAVLAAIAAWRLRLSPVWVVAGGAALGRMSYGFVSL